MSIYLLKPQRKFVQSREKQSIPDYSFKEYKDLSCVNEQIQINKDLNKNKCRGQNNFTKGI